MGVIYGQVTASYELIQQEENFDFIITPVGGGELLAGICLFMQKFSPNTKIISAKPLKADDSYRFLKSGKIETNQTTNTIADGLRTNLGDHNFPII